MAKCLSEPDGPDAPQGGLFEDEPKANSPEDLGLVTPPGRKIEKLFGTSTMPEPERPPINLAPGVIQLEHARKFCDWINDQELPVHVDVTPGRILVTLSGMGLDDLRWLCLACKQAKRVPNPITMKNAAIARDVRILRPGGDLETSQRGSY